MIYHKGEFSIFEEWGENLGIKIINYIKKNFPQFLGSDINLLDSKDGIRKLEKKYNGCGEQKRNKS